MTPLDPAIPFLERALDIEAARSELERQLGAIDLHAARLIRHKPSRRCLIEYDVTTPAGPLTVLGKVRAKGLDTRTHVTQTACWRAGLPVPEPLGLVPQFQMLLQRKVPGVPLSSVLGGPEGVDLARRVAETVDSLHRVGIPSDRQHTVDDELRILSEQLSRVAQCRPSWKGRVTRVLANCNRLATTISTPPSRPCGIHRDFYADQMLVNGDSLILLDLDLYSEGDPALDIGNFVAHITEQSLRERGDAEALVDREQALVESFLLLAGETRRADITTWTSLALARHIGISNRIPERRHLTEALLDLCEQRFTCVL